MNKFVYNLIVIFYFFLFPLIGTSQIINENCKILGKTKPFAFVIVDDNKLSTTSNIDGDFTIEGLLPGVYNLVVSASGFQQKTVFEIETTPSRPAYLNIKLQPLAINLKGAEVVIDENKNVEESPLSVRSIGTDEIKRNPGGGRDISKVTRIQKSR